MPVKPRMSTQGRRGSKSLRDSYLLRVENLLCWPGPSSRNFSAASGIFRQNPGISRQKSLIPWVSRDIPNFLAPTPSRGRPPTPPENIRTQKFRFGFLFRAWSSESRRGFFVVNILEDSGAFCHKNELAWPPLQSLAVKKNIFLCKFWAVKNLSLLRFVEKCRWNIFKRPERG